MTAVEPWSGHYDIMGPVWVSGEIVWPCRVRLCCSEFNSSQARSQGGGGGGGGAKVLEHHLDVYGVLYILRE